MEWVMVRALLSLVAVLGLMAGVVIVLKKYAYKGQNSNAAIVGVEVLGSRMLSPKRSVQVLRILNKIIVVGITEGGMTTLGEISDAESLREVDSRLTLRTKSSTPFSGWMEKYIGSVLPIGSGNGRLGRTSLG